MARVFIEGFETGGTYLWDVAVGVSVQSTTKYTGTYALYHAGGGYYARKTLPASSTYYVAFRCVWTYFSGSTRDTFHLREAGSTSHVRIAYWNNGGSNKLLFYSGTTYLGEYTEMLTWRWYLVEVYAYIHNTSGRLTVKLDGIEVFDYTGDTSQGYTSQIDEIRLGNAYVSTEGQYYDDLVVDDANWIGDTRIYGMAVDGAGNTTQWNPSAGSNYQCVDEIPASASDYNYINAIDQKDTFSVGSLGSVYSVKCVQPSAIARKEGASTPLNLALVIRPPVGGTDYDSSDQELSTAWKGYAAIWENNPYTASAWTETEVNSSEIGYKSRT